MPEAPQKLIGSIYWAEQAHVEDADVNRAILRPNGELVIDFVFDGCRYTVTLRNIGENEYRGRYVTHYEGRRVEGPVTCRLYTAGRQHMLLGSWEEDQQSYRWWGELEQTERFADER